MKYRYYIRAEVWGYVEADNEDDALDMFCAVNPFENMAGDFDFVEIEKFNIDD